MRLEWMTSGTSVLTDFSEGNSDTLSGGQCDSHGHATVVYDACKGIILMEYQHTIQAKVSAKCFSILCGA